MFFCYYRANIVIFSQNIKYNIQTMQANLINSLAFSLFFLHVYIAAISTTSPRVGCAWIISFNSSTEASLFISTATS